MLTITVRGQQLQLRTPLIVADSINYITARFAFDKDWDGRSITAFFVQKNTVITAILQNNEITAEQGINLTAGIWELKLTGVKGNSRITAGPARMTVLPFGTIDGDLPDINPSQYEQILGLIGSLDDLTTESKENLVAAINEAATKGGGEAAGENGATFFPHVSPEGDISWTNDKGLRNPETVNIKGPVGGKGPEGTGIESITYAGQDAEGGNMYTVLLTDGTSYVITAPKGEAGAGGTSFETDETLYFRDGVLGVNTAHEPDPDNTLPITSAAVAQTVGNINAILKTI